MAVKLGSSNATFKVGSSNVSKIYKGTNIVFEAIIATIPDQVTNFTASVWMENDPQYPDAIELLWDAPDNGGSAITGYDIQYISNQDINLDIQNWTNIDNVTFPSLIWYDGGSLTRYYFRIRAKNNIGDGPWSSIIPPQSYDGGIQFPKGGCTDTSAFNYDPTATRSNGNCTYDVYGCTDPGASNYNPSANIDDGSCTYGVYGCTDPGANNYNPSASIDDGSCTYE